MGKQKASGLNGTTVFIEMVREQLKRGLPGYDLKIREDAPDNFGIHWRGFRAWVSSGDVQIYIHTGLVYHPDTRAGIYTEIDRRNNREIFDTAWEHIKPSDQYDLCKEEADYLKFFYPACKWDELMEAESADKQCGLWCRYFETVLMSLSEALGTKRGTAEVNRKAAATEGKGFAFSIWHLHQLYALTKQFTDALQAAEVQDTGTELHKRAEDRFGAYSAGSRLFVHDSRAGRNLYLWCGLLFTDEKKSGLIIEADRYSNRDSFEVLKDKLKESEKYEAETSDDFIKLFLPAECFWRLREMVMEEGEESGAKQILDSFIQAAVSAFKETAEDTRTNEEVVFAAARAVAGEIKILYGELAATFSQTKDHAKTVSDPQTWMEAARAGIKKAAGCSRGKAILSVNPEGVAAPERYTLYLECSQEPDMAQVCMAVEKALENYGDWKEKLPPVYDGQKITVILEKIEGGRTN